MPAVADVIAYLDDLLRIGEFEDLGPNGLQVPAEREVERVVTGVTAQRELIERAVAGDAQLVLVHHGLFWRFNPVGLTPVLAERLRPLFRHDVALAGYHLPLDAHPVVGNNALLAGALGCDAHVAFGTVGRGGTFAAPVPVGELAARVARACGGREPLVQGDGPAAVRRIAIVSGGAAGELPRAIAEGYDAFLTGEPKE
ncbi:MAG TPA: Nif3-like dinuclear metal center hexameric protein, partial [Solirubrobacteraceae bacterium]|nr:Nif3-like dinuclear metal center hexameric protein [Solirubrobacteraceae bacterium]